VHFHHRFLGIVRGGITTPFSERRFAAPVERRFDLVARFVVMFPFRRR
jgi:hypothetical protein